MGNIVRTLLVTNTYPTADAPHAGTFVRNIADSLHASGLFDLRLVRLNRGRALPLRYLGFFGRTLARLLACRLDLVYVHYISHSGVACLPVIRRGRGPALVLHCHGSDVAPDPGESQRRQRIKQWIASRLLDRAALVVIPSAYFENYIRENYGYRGRTLISPSGGVDCTVFHPQDAGERIPGRLLFAGRMVAGKGAPLAAAAMREAAKADSRVSGELIGEGPEAAVVDTELAGEGAAERILRRGAVDQPGLAAAMRRADIFLFPSTRAGESLGLTAVEAILCGAVPLVLDNGAMREVIPPEFADRLIADSADDFTRKLQGLLAHSFSERRQWSQQLIEHVRPRYEAGEAATGLQFALRAAVTQHASQTLPVAEGGRE